MIAVPLTLVSSGASAAPVHVDNPYSGATQYVNATWSTAVTNAASRATDPALAAKMRAIKDQPTAVWMDRISAITGNVDGLGLQHHLDAALAQKQADVPLVLNLVIYDLPGRDCYALASNGELPATDAGLARYKTEYIDPIAALLADPKYQDIRIAATIEPDSLPNLITNISAPECQTAAPYYKAGVKYALDKLHAIPNVYNYIDAGHSGWLGWPSNSGPSATLFADVAKTTTAGFASIDGFVTNTANTSPLSEPFLTNPTLQVGGSPVKSSSYYEWNDDFDEVDWTAHLYSLVVAAGFPSTTGMLIDTSRNGWGGTARPTAVSTSTVLNTYVDQSRIDRRIHRGAWCNPLGAGIGERPQATPSGYASSHLDAFVWIKPPGESDGAATEIANDEGKRFDRMCDPTYVSPKLANQLTGAFPGAPLAGQWFEAQFAQLVQNAYPVIAGGTTPTDTTAPTTPTALAAGTVTSTSVALTWTASTDAVGVTAYDVYRGTTLVGSPTTTSFTATGLAASTAYSFTVKARDAAGNASNASSTLSVTTAAGSTPTPTPTITPTPTPTVTPTTPPTTPGACTVKYVANSWGSGFSGNIKVTNSSSTPINGWSLAFAFPNGQTITQGWSATWSQTGANVTVTNAAWNGSLAAGASADIGFNGSHTGTNANPTSFTLNGTTCAVS